MLSSGLRLAWLERLGRLHACIEQITFRLRVSSPGFSSTGNSKLLKTLLLTIRDSSSTGNSKLLKTLLLTMERDNRPLQLIILHFSQPLFHMGRIPSRSNGRTGMDHRKTSSVVPPGNSELFEIPAKRRAIAVIECYYPQQYYFVPQRHSRAVKLRLRGPLDPQAKIRVVVAVHLHR